MPDLSGVELKPAINHLHRATLLKIISFYKKIIYNWIAGILFCRLREKQGISSRTIVPDFGKGVCVSTAFNRTALITGASSGIGLELAKLFAKDGYRLALVARSRQKLDELAGQFEKQYGIAVVVIGEDLALPGSPQVIYEKLLKENIQIDTLVNNAGFGLLGEFGKSDLSGYLEMIQVNITSLTRLTRLFLPSMIARKSGQILNVASTAAFQPGPYMAVYYASKAYVLSFSLALREELSGTGVYVSALCPGPTKTGFQNRAGIENIRLLKQLSNMTAGEVAEFGYRKFQQNKPLIIPGFLNKIGAASSRLMPRAWSAKIVKYLHGKIPNN